MYSFVAGKTGSYELNPEEWSALEEFRRGEPDLPARRSAVALGWLVAPLRRLTGDTGGA
jgi:hypothetical protein